MKKRFKELVMKRIWLGVLLFLCCLIPQKVEATPMGTTPGFKLDYDGDDWEPVLNSIEVLDEKAINRGEEVALSLNVTENVSIKEVQLIFRRMSGNREVEIIKDCVMEGNKGGGTYNLKVKVDTSDMISAEYHIGGVILVDSSGNSVSYAGGYPIELDENGYYLVENEKWRKCYLTEKECFTVIYDGDETQPIIKSVKFEQTEAVIPSEISVLVKVEDDSELENLWVDICNKNKDHIFPDLYGTMDMVQKVSENLYRLKFFVPSDAKAGEYVIRGVSAQDIYGNVSYYSDGGGAFNQSNGAYYLTNYQNYWNDLTDTCYVSEGQVLNVSYEYEVGCEGELTDSDLVSRIKAMPEGKAARILVDNPTGSSVVCKKELFDAIKGKDKTIVLYSWGSYEWIFNGKHINNETKDIDLNIFVHGEALYNEDGSVEFENVCIRFAPNGILPGKATVRVSSSSIDLQMQSFQNKDAKVYLYYLNPEDNSYTLEEDSNVKCAVATQEEKKSFWCEFDITHNSTYVVSTDEKDTKVDAKKISISGISKKIATGKKIKLTAKVTPSNATNKKVTWSLDKKSKKYASVNKNTGVVTTKKKGAGKTIMVTATAKDGSKKKATYKIKIMKHAVKSVKLKVSKTKLKVGKTLKIKATVKTTGKSANKTLKWTSSNTKYATVSKSGTVKAKKAGKGKKVKITAWATDGTGKKATVKIQIK